MKDIYFGDYSKKDNNGALCDDVSGNGRYVVKGG